MIKRTLLGLFFLMISSLTLAGQFYGGVKAGGNFLSVKKNIMEKTMQPPLPDMMSSLYNNASARGILGGVFLGYDMHFERFTLAFEAEASRNNAKTHQSDQNFESLNLPVSVSENVKTNFSASVKPGWFFNEKTRLYGKVGVVRGKFRSNSSDNDAGTMGNSDAFHKWLTGLLLGGGIELFIHPNLAMNLEYNHIQYKKFSKASMPASLNGDPSFSTTLITTTYRPRSDNVTLGLTYYLNNATDNLLGVDEDAVKGVDTTIPPIPNPEKEELV